MYSPDPVWIILLDFIFRRFRDTVTNAKLTIFLSDVIRNRIYIKGVVPYRYVKYVIVIPRDLQTTSMLWQSIIRSPLFSVWSLTIIMFTGLRKLLQYLTGFSGTIGEIFFDTFARSFGMAGYQRINNRPEKILMLFLSFVALLAGIIFSGMFFEQITVVQSQPTIRTLKALEASKLPIMMPDRFGRDIIRWWNNT